MSTVKISNNTKGASGFLAQFRLVDADLEVCGQLLVAGESMTLPVEDWELQKRSYERLVKLGALSVEDVPEAEPAKDPSPALVRINRKKDEPQTEG